MKYELTNESIKVFGRTLHRIRALKNIGTNVKEGDLGGFIQSESNLSQEGDCWIFDSVKVFDNAKVYDSAKIYNSARVFGEAEIFGEAKVFDKAEVFSLAKVYDLANVFGESEVYGLAKVFDSAVVYDSARVFGEAMVYDLAELCGKVKVYDSAKVLGSTIVQDSAEICGSAQITKTTDVFTIAPIGSRNATTTFYRSKGGKIFVKCGCKNTDIDTWLDMVQKTHGNNNHAKAYRLAARLARLQILGE